MDGNGSVNMRNWEFFEPPVTAFKGRFGLHLLSTVDSEKPLFSGGGGGGRDLQQDHRQHQQQPRHHGRHLSHPALVPASTNGDFLHHHQVGGHAESSISMNYLIRDSWTNHNREKYLNILPSSNHHHHHSNYVVLPHMSSSHSMQMLNMSNLSENEIVPLSDSQLQKTCEDKDVSHGIVKKRGRGKVSADKLPRVKKAKKAPRAPKDESAPSVQRARTPKKSAEVVINGLSMDISGIPIPVCTCTGTPQQCYRWGLGGWQSACCTTGVSMYPLPMSTKRRGAKIAGRKMSIGAFKKVLEKLASEGYNFANPINLGNFWAKHGTNKFVTIR